MTSHQTTCLGPPACLCCLPPLPHLYRPPLQAAAIGVMYLSTMAGALDPAELAMYAALLMDSDNSEMIEFLMAGMWILLRNPDNRKVRMHALMGATP